jgi:hypothetical protein
VLGTKSPKYLEMAQGHIVLAWSRLGRRRGAGPAGGAAVREGGSAGVGRPAAGG